MQRKQYVETKIVEMNLKLSNACSITYSKGIYEFSFTYTSPAVYFKTAAISCIRCVIGVTKNKYDLYYIRFVSRACNLSQEYV